MKFVGCGDKYGINILAIDHVFELDVEVFKLEFACHLTRPFGRSVCNRHQTCLGNESPEIFRVPLSHFPHAEHANSKFAHESVSPGLFNSCSYDAGAQML